MWTYIGISAQEFLLHNDGTNFENTLIIYRLLRTRWVSGFNSDGITRIITVYGRTNQLNFTVERSDCLRDKWQINQLTIICGFYDSMYAYLVKNL